MPARASAVTARVGPGTGTLCRAASRHGQEREIAVERWHVHRASIAVLAVALAGTASLVPSGTVGRGGADPGGSNRRSPDRSGSRCPTASSWRCASAGAARSSTASCRPGRSSSSSAPTARAAAPRPAGPDYNYLQVHIRGTGDSDGSFDALGPRTQQDVAEVLEWACGQPWSNGRLGLIGFSASAIVVYNSLHLELPCVETAVLGVRHPRAVPRPALPGRHPQQPPRRSACFGLIGAPLVQALPTGSGRDPLVARPGRRRHGRSCRSTTSSTRRSTASGASAASAATSTTSRS